MLYRHKRLDAHKDMSSIRCCAAPSKMARQSRAGALTSSATCCVHAGPWKRSCPVLWTSSDPAGPALPPPRAQSREQQQSTLAPTACFGAERWSAQADRTERTAGERSRTGLLDLERSGDGDRGKGDGERSRGDADRGARSAKGEPAGLGLREVMSLRCTQSPLSDSLQANRQG